MKANINYIALGDDFTIGEGLFEKQRFPAQLSLALQNKGYTFSRQWVLAGKNWTTEDLTQMLVQEHPKGDFDMVTLLIGANDLILRKDVYQYRTSFTDLVQRAILLADNQPQHVLVFSIPDYSFTNLISKGNRVKISSDIAAFNQVNKEVAMHFGLNYFNITPISQKALSNKSLLTADRKYPSAEMYSQWVKSVLPEVEALFNSQ